MTPERWKRVEAVYAAVTARPVSTRADAMADLCGNDADLRREVESLLAHADAAAEFLETPAFPAADIASERALIGRLVGPYRIMSLLGAGGMGEVYRAHDEQLDREVAIKFLPRLSTDPRVVARFEVEARALAALNCPHIGAILASSTWTAARSWCSSSWMARRSRNASSRRACLWEKH